MPYCCECDGRGGTTGDWTPRQRLQCLMNLLVELTAYWSLAAPDPAGRESFWASFRGVPSPPCWRQTGYQDPAVKPTGEQLPPASPSTDVSGEAQTWWLCSVSAQACGQARPPPARTHCSPPSTSRKSRLRARVRSRGLGVLEVPGVVWTRVPGRSSSSRRSSSSSRHSRGRWLRARRPSRPPGRKLRRARQVGRGGCERGGRWGCARPYRAPSGAASRGGRGEGGDTESQGPSCVRRAAIREAQQPRGGTALPPPAPRQLPRAKLASAESPLASRRGFPPPLRLFPLPLLRGGALGCSPPPLNLPGQAGPLLSEGHLQPEASREHTASPSACSRPRPLRGLRTSVSAATGALGSRFPGTGPCGLVWGKREFLEMGGGTL
ncbi:uncharacterized protein AAG666_008234 [Megaptera novaeangliae]